jgi:3-deoxy-D-manno-octulosonic-acid transferase
LGEVNALLPLARLFAESFQILFTSGTPAGVRAAGEFPSLRFSDNPGFVRRGLSSATALVIAESELWPNLLMTAKSMGVPAFLVNARVNKGTKRWLAVKGFLSEMLSAFREIYPKDEREAEKIIGLGVARERVVCLGGLKFDGLSGSYSARREDFGFSVDIPLIAFGSVRSGEFKQVVEAVTALRGFQVAVAPRHTNRLGKLLREMRKRGIPFRLRRDSGKEGVLVLDTVGELRAIYSVSDLAFVGGTLAAYGGHNILEPAAMGVPVIIGPHYENQVSEAEGLLSAGGGLLVLGPAELAEAARRILSDERARREMGKRAREFVEENRGASKRIHRRILELI